MTFPINRAWFLVGTVLCAEPVTAQTLSRGALISLIDSTVQAELRDGPTAGFSIAVQYKGELVLARGYGFADLEHRIPASVETVFKVGSVTKQFTAAALLQLVDQGKVKLEEDVRTYLPDAPTGGRRVTVEQLLNHTSGIKNYTSLGPAFGRDTFRLDLTPARIEGYLQNQPFDFAPGSGWLYNNSAYILAGLVIEKVSGQPYAEYLRQHIFEPLGLGSTSYCDDRAVVPHRAKGYDRAAGGFVNTEPISMTVPYAAGSICSTVLDLLAWRQALGTGRLFSKPLYERMIKPAVLSNGWRTNYGYGLARYRLGPVEVIRHGGTINGFQANLMYVPAADLIIAALANTSGADPVGVADRLAARLVGAAVAPRIAPAPVPVAELTDYIGRYEMAPYSIEVTAPAGQLQMAPAGFPVPARLNRQAADQFLAGPLYALGFYGSAAPLRFVREGGKVSGFELDNPLGGVIRARRVAP